MPRVRVPHQRIECGRHKSYRPWTSVAPTVGPDIRAGADGIVGERFVAGRRVGEIAVGIEDPLHQRRACEATPKP